LLKKEKKKEKAFHFVRNFNQGKKSKIGNIKKKVVNLNL